MVGNVPRYHRYNESPKLLAHSRRRIEHSRLQMAWSFTRLLRTGNDGDRVRLSATEQVLLELLDQPCDLDVLLFFHRHPLTFATTHDLARRVGYRLRQIRASLKVLRRAGFLTWSKSPTADMAPAARLYRFAPMLPAELLHSFFWLAESPDGRCALRQALSEKTTATR